MQGVIMSDTSLICFDLDDTLIREIHSVMYLSILNNKLEELLEGEKREAKGEFTWIEANYHKVKCAQGLNVEKIATELNRVLRPIRHVAHVIAALHKYGFKCLLITAGPKQVAKVASELWGFDGYYGSDYEVVDGKFTGEIINHTGDKGKIICLQAYCNQTKIDPDYCFAVGDGASDIPLFEVCGGSIAINYSEATIGNASYYLKTDDLSDILDLIIS